MVGAGTMGRGIAHVSAAGGFQTILQDVSAEALAEAQTEVARNLNQGVELGKIAGATRTEALSKLRTSTELEDAASADLIIEAVPENLKLKCELFRKLSAICSDSAVFASNTSSFSIGEIARTSKRPELFLGMHFFNPVHKMRLVEIVRHAEMAPETLAAALDVAKTMGKETVVVKDSPGFVTSRINALIGNEAFRMLEEGIASPEDIDKALKLGLNHPMGPFELADLVGLDVRLSILRYLHETLGENYRPSPLLEKHVSEGRLGRKTGQGVYRYKP